MTTGTHHAKRSARMPSSTTANTSVTASARSFSDRWRRARIRSLPSAETMRWSGRENVTTERDRTSAYELIRGWRLPSLFDAEIEVEQRRSGVIGDDASPRALRVAQRETGARRTLLNAHAGSGSAAREDQRSGEAGLARRHLGRAGSAGSRRRGRPGRAW